MRSFITLLATVSALLVGSLATPKPDSNAWGKVKRPSWPGRPNRDPSCMDSSDAQTVADNFRESIANYSDALALAAFTSDFHDYSDSVIELIDNGCPSSPQAVSTTPTFRASGLSTNIHRQLGSATFDSRAAFMTGQGAQPPIPFQQLNLWHNCDTVTLRWVSSGSGQEPEQVTGIIVLETVYSNSTWLIRTVYSEFNSGAWLVNLGIFKPSNCSV